MTEADWQACKDPEKMLIFLQGRASDRKLRLFACGCARRVWNLLADNRSREAVEKAERFADGQATGEELANARDAARDAHQAAAWIAFFSDAWTSGAESASAAAAEKALDAATYSASFAVWAAAGSAAWGHDESTAWAAAEAAEQESQAALLRDLWGPCPFRPAACDPTWRTETAVQLALGIYDSRDFSGMPILADALEDAGCTDAGILGHSRGGGEHGRGCWVVDLVLERR